MKTSQKAVLTFAIAAISTLSGGTQDSILQALRDEKYLTTASIMDSGSFQPVLFQNVKPNVTKTTSGTAKGSPGLKKFTILPVADTLRRPVW